MRQRTLAHRWPFSIKLRSATTFHRGHDPSGEPRDIEGSAMTVHSIDTGDVRVEINEHVVVVTIDRPSKRNALTQAMYATISDTLLAADIDGDVGAVVMTGTGTVFTAGNDLADFSSGARLDEVQRFLLTISSVQLPLVAAVNGLAVGVGLTMLLHCDLVFVEPNAKLYVPFVELGLVPEAASSLLLPKVVGDRRAAELLLLGRRIDGIEAAAWDLPTRPSHQHWIMLSQPRIILPSNLRTP